MQLQGLYCTATARLLKTYGSRFNFVCVLNTTSQCASHEGAAHALGSSRGTDGMNGLKGISHKARYLQLTTKKAASYCTPRLNINQIIQK